MDSQVEEIKKKLNIVTVISRFLPLKKKGRNHWANCPFHGEKTPSFTVSEELQIYKCFGCGVSGDIFTFLQEYEKIDFKEALETLAKMAGVTLVKSVGLSREESHRKKLLDINTHTAKFYHYVLTSHPLGKPALDYVLNRGITLDTVKKFQLGFSPARSQSLVNHLRQKGFSPEDLIATGTFGPSRYGSGLYDRFQGRLVFPLNDYRDRILGFSGRILPGSKPELAKYVNSPETELYHKSLTLFGLNLAKEAIRREQSVIVVEGEFDLISPWQSGIQNIVAIKGTAFTDDQLKLLKRYTDTLILALDSDFAGSNSARKSIEAADALGFDIKVVSLGDQFKDPDEAVRADPLAFKEQITNAVSVWDFYIKAALKIYGGESDKSVKQIKDFCLPSFVKIQDRVLQGRYYQKLALALGSTAEDIRLEAQKYLSGAATATSRPLTGTASNPVNPISPLSLPGNVSDRGNPIASQSSTKVEKLEEFLTALIFSAKKPAALAAKVKKSLQIVSFPPYRRLIDLLLAAPDYDPLTFSQSLPAELQDTFRNLYLLTDDLGLDSPKRSAEIKKVIRNLQVIKLKSQIKQLSAKIAQLEDSDDQEEFRQIVTNYNLLLQKLAQVENTKS